MTILGDGLSPEKKISRPMPGPMPNSVRPMHVIMPFHQRRKKKNHTISSIGSMMGRVNLNTYPRNEGVRTR